MTGATHARELLSMQVPLMECLKLIHNGYIHKNEKYTQMLRDQKFYFIPTVNVDGAALVEEQPVHGGDVADVPGGRTSERASEGAGARTSRGRCSSGGRAGERAKGELCRCLCVCRGGGCGGGGEKAREVGEGDEGKRGGGGMGGERGKEEAGKGGR